MNALYDLKDMLLNQLEEYGERGEMSASVLEKVDTLAHAVKNLDKVIECCDGNNPGHNRSSRQSHDGAYRSNNSRNSNRHSRNSYHPNSFADRLYAMADEAEDDETRESLERLASRMNQM